MSLSFEGSTQYDRPPAELWPYFTDPDRLAECAPGVEDLTLVDGSHLEGVITVGVGSVTPEFDVEAVVVELVEPDRLVMRADGTGARNTFETVATMELTATGEGARLEWEAEATVSGLLASLGQRALRSVTKRLVGQFFDCMQERIEAGVGARSQLSAASEAESGLE